MQDDINSIAEVPVPVCAGIALGLQYQKKDAFALYSDGTGNQGQIFEAYNIE